MTISVVDVFTALSDPVRRALLDELSGRAPRIPAHVLDGLDLEVRRTVRGRAADRHARSERKDAG